jgi:PKD repeat protein
VNAGPAASLDEGGTFTSSGSFTDPGADTWTATVNYGDGSGAQPLPLSGKTFSLSHTYADNGLYTVTVAVTDKDGSVGTGTTSVTVNNVAPTVGAINAPISPVLLKTTINTSANFTDPGVLDTHTAVWDWGDGTTSAGVVNESNGSGSVNGSHVYTAVGPYTIRLTVTDKDGDSAQAVLQYQVIYNFIGFTQPVDNPPTLNTANSGQAIPLKWRITDANGQPVTNLASVVVTAVSLSCPLGGTPDQIEEYAAGNSGLQNQGNGYYQFNWKTPKTYANSCKTMKLDLGEGPGMERTALFQFPK